MPLLLNMRTGNLFLQTYKFFSEKIYTLEGFVVKLAISFLFIHFLLIFLAKNGFIQNSFLANQSFLEVIATAFTVILIYEIFLLVLSVGKSLSYSIGKQYEIIVLVLIRDVFKVISGIQTDQIVANNYGDFLFIALDIAFAMLCFVLLWFYYKVQFNCTKILLKQEKEKSFTIYKAASSVVLLIILIAYLVEYIALPVISPSIELFFNNFKKIGFLSDFFVIMIIIDVLLLLLTFQQTHKFKDIFYEAVLIISAIVIRFAFIAVSPFNGILALFGILIGCVISYLYSRLDTFWDFEKRNENS